MFSSGTFQRYLYEIESTQKRLRALYERITEQASDEQVRNRLSGLNKLPKWVLDRRLQQMEAEGVAFEPSVNVGTDISIQYLLRSFDAVLLAGGAGGPRGLPGAGGALKRGDFANFLTRQNRINAGDIIPESDRISAEGKNVIVIGGGDTGADCVGTSIRQGANSVRQLEILPKPPEEIDASTPWPMWPKVLRTSTSHEEGCEREWSVMTTEFLGDSSQCVAKLKTVAVEWEKNKDGRFIPVKQSGSERELEAGLVLLAMGFTREGNAGILNEFGVETCEDCAPQLNDDYMSNVDGVFVAGDLSQGASLVVRAIADGRRAAAGIDRYLGKTQADK